VLLFRRDSSRISVKSSAARGKRIYRARLVCLIESIIQKDINVFGKPSKFYFENAISKLKSISVNDKNTTKQVVIIGDDYQTDILNSKEFGLNTVLVKSGKYEDGQEDLCKPDFVTDDLLMIV